MNPAKRPTSRRRARNGVPAPKTPGDAPRQSTGSMRSDLNALPRQEADLAPGLIDALYRLRQGPDAEAEAVLVEALRRNWEYDAFPMALYMVTRGRLMLGHAVLDVLSGTVQRVMTPRAVPRPFRCSHMDFHHAWVIRHGSLADHIGVAVICNYYRHVGDVFCREARDRFVTWKNLLERAFNVDQAGSGDAGGKGA
ncbi:MAG: hypothetical protein KBH78_07580 [Candidatus Hydrogenedentes bacterium]|nr:hypothetical protein [Candidatus Hydrogenedentota bacterium]